MNQTQNNNYKGKETYRFQVFSFPPEERIPSVDEMCRVAAGKEGRDSCIAETNIQHDRVPNFFCGDAVIDTFGVENERADTKVFGPQHIIDAVLKWVNRVVQNSI